jgi:hypothetical protein
MCNTTYARWVIKRRTRGRLAKKFPSKVQSTFFTSLNELRIDKANIEAMA